nr:MAG TPA: hypothetical protein [Caudoviricetes sp.]
MDYNEKYGSLVDYSKHFIGFYWLFRDSLWLCKRFK